MKQALNIVLCILLVTLCCTSCFTAIAVSENSRMESGRDLGKQQASFVLTTVQKISPYAALARTGKGDTVCVLAKFERYYDGMVLKGKFICKGTYTYISAGGAERNVLVYAYKKDMKALSKEIERFLSEKPPLVMDEHRTI